jgi:hypothetical protein
VRRGGGGGAPAPGFDARCRVRDWVGFDPRGAEPRFEDNRLGVCVCCVRKNYKILSACP